MQIDSQNKEQKLAYELIAKTNNSFFLTGRAGTGKTTFLRNVQETVKKQFVILAPTGVAAILAGGQTIHSFFGLPLGICDSDTIGVINKSKFGIIYNADTIIIDEVSMVRCDIIDAIDRTLRKTLRTPKPFGGKQIVFVGDVFQLPPVVTSKAERENLIDLYHTDEFFFFNANVIQKMGLAKIEFTKVYRQNDDSDYRHILENVRMNKMTDEDLLLLNSRVAKPSSSDGLIITLTTINKTADRVNEQKLKEIPSEEMVYEGKLEGKFESQRFPADLHLVLKVGAQVMLTHNDPYRRWGNGTLCTVECLEDKLVQVKLQNGQVCSVSQATWSSYNYEYDPKKHKLTKRLTGRFTQYPLRLAWAITVHKSQGMTFDKMEFDLSRGLFVPGQLYVALSRVRSLSGLFLSKPIAIRYANTDREVLLYAKGYNDTDAIQSAIESGKAVFDLLRNGDDDAAARQYLLLTEKKVLAHNLQEATQLAQCFLNTVVSDEELVGCVKEMPDGLLPENHLSTKFLTAMFCLYAGAHEKAVRLANDVLACHSCREALYIKARALDLLGRHDEADITYNQLGEQTDISQPDAKTLYALAMHNELYVGEPGLSMMQMLLGLKPRYDHGICALRELMKHKGIQLEASGESELIDAFNSDMGEKDFISMLKAWRTKEYKAVDELIECLKMQKFKK